MKTYNERINEHKIIRDFCKELNAEFGESLRINVSTKNGLKEMGSIIRKQALDGTALANKIDDFLCEDNYVIRPNPEPESKTIDPIIVEGARRYVQEKENDE
jgi:hypothetical protein